MIIAISGYIGSGKDTLGAMIQYQFYLKRFKEDSSYYGTAELLSWKEFQEYPINNNSNLPGKSLSGIEIRKFGYALKQIVCILTGATLSQLEDQEFKKKELPAIWNRSVKEAREWLILQHFRFNNLYTPSDEQVIKYATQLNFKWTRTYREMMQEIGTEVMRNHFVDDVWINALMGKYTPFYIGEATNQSYPDWIITDCRFPNEAKTVKEAGGLLIRIDGLPRVSDHPSEISLDNYQEFDVHLTNGFASKDMSREESLSNLMKDAAYLVNHFKLSEYAGTNIKPNPDSESGSAGNPQ